MPGLTVSARWRRTIVLGVFGVGIACGAGTAMGLPEQIHSLISFEAARLPGVPEEFREVDVLGPANGQPVDGDDTLITEGSYDEDMDRYPDALLGFLRILDRELIWGWGSHFWDPSAGPERGQLLLLNPPPAQNAYERGRMLYAEAVGLYGSDPGRAYYLLGRVAHLLEDVATPAHVHLDPHVSDGLADFLKMPDLGADSFEGYLQRTYVDAAGDTDLEDVAGRLQFEQDFGVDGLVPVSPVYLSDAGRGDLGDLFKLFHSMASHAARWDSDDNDGTGAEGMGGGSIRTAVPTGNRVTLYQITDADCGRMASDLMPEAISHVAGLYRLFRRDVQPGEVLEAAESLAGDINGDGKVGLFDLLRLVGVFGTGMGQPGFDAAADLDGSGAVNVADLHILVVNFGHVG